MCALLALWAGAACMTPPAEDPLPAPDANARLSYFEGSIPSGPRAPDAAVERRWEDALELRWELRYVERDVELDLPALPRHATRVLSSRGESLLRAAPRLGRAARVATGEAARGFAQRLDASESARDALGRCVTLLEDRGALARGVTAVLGVQSNVELRVPGEGPARGGFALQLARGRDGELQAAVVLEGLVPSASDAAAVQIEREHVLIDRCPTVDGDGLLLWVPASIGHLPGAFALFVDVATPTPGDGEFARAVEHSERELGAEGERAASLGRELPQSDLFRREVDGVFQAFDLERYHRSALVFLTGSSGAKLAQEIALVADDRQLADYVARVVQLSKDDRVRADDAAAVGWLLERCAYTHLAERAEARELAPELAACLLTQAGALGRTPSVLPNLIGACENLEELRLRLLEDNWIALEDTQLPARVRAFDWLRRQGQPLADFDPLADRETRRGALVRALQARATAGAQR